jgi:haloacetate dehalogenase
MDVFPGFTSFDLAGVHGRRSRSGDGPPLLLLHGIPETHLMWHRVAPALAEDFTVVATDLRGYGDSAKPPSTEDHAPYAMRAVAAEQVEVMAQLGYRRFFVAGHDRGARCAYRMALDHPSVVRRLAVLDVVPTWDAFARADMDFALGYWVWSFLAAPAPVPERLIAGDPEGFVNHMLDAWSTVDVFADFVRAEYVAKFRDPDTVHAICEQYRAAATLDFQHDNADRTGTKRISCPVLALWSGAGPLAAWYDPLDIWRGWADTVTGGPIDAGHFLPEEAPEVVTQRLRAFFATG